LNISLPVPAIVFTGATQLALWARGQYGGERINIGVGLIGKDKPHPDSDSTTVEGMVIKPAWRRYRNPQAKMVLSGIKTGFVVNHSSQSSSVTAYLDNIRFVR
jgi:hypothetical protein